MAKRKRSRKTRCRCTRVKSRMICRRVTAKGKFTRGSCRKSPKRRRKGWKRVGSRSGAYMWSGRR